MFDVSIEVGLQPIEKRRRPPRGSRNGNDDDDIVVEDPKMKNR
jgi:hypothetical protein